MLQISVQLKAEKTEGSSIHIPQLFRTERRLRSNSLSARTMSDTVGAVSDGHWLGKAFRRIRSRSHAVYRRIAQV